MMPKIPKKEIHDMKAVDRIAIFLEKTRLGDYMDLMQKPHRLAWLNFWAGVWRGFGMVVGSLVVVAIAAWGVKYAFKHVGGMPWVGAQLKEALGWLLEVIDEKRQGG
jgi:hypothetical protein